MVDRLEAAQPALGRTATKRPAFAKRYPASIELDELLATFEAGDHGQVQEQAKTLAADTKDPDVRRAAEDLLRRLQPGRLATYLFLLPVGLLLILLAHYLLGNH